MKSVINILPTIEKNDLDFFTHHKKTTAKVWEERIINELQTYFPNSTIVLFESGRSALDFLAGALLHSNDKIYTQSFTCSAVVYPFLKHGAFPIYIDIDKETFNINFEDTVKKRDPAARALLIQYTFGLMPKKLKELFKFAKKNNLILIEDLAHGLGNKVEGTFLGNSGDFAILSFGRDKVISSVTGGALVIRNSAYKKYLLNLYRKLPALSNKQQNKLVFYLRFMSAIKQFYYYKWARVLIFFLQKLHILGLAVSVQEKHGVKTKRLPHKFPHKMLPLLYHQLQKLPHLTKTRTHITREYNRRYKQNFKGSLLKYPLLQNNPDRLVKKMRARHIYLDRWYSNIIDPRGVNLKNYLYEKGDCPVAEQVSAQIVNLPTLVKIELGG